MAANATYFVVYAEELTGEDRAALSRPGFRLYPDGIAVSDAWFVGQPPGPAEFHVRQVVRLQAEDEDEAVRLVVDALGRTPQGIYAARGRE